MSASLAPPSASEPFALPAADVAARLGVDPGVGLDGTEVAARHARLGSNEIEPAKRPGIWRMIAEAATEPFVLLLLAAGIGA
ncbi:MAG TPA: cation-transporting P-type ATPase, partial [Clostridia bacterium]|nr:cation-transporting P-type ATPase [Clostridia bacterium]